ncbi:MAG TPA: preprotein translocase subunit SecE [Patescibacteria group bacterium]|nr:preprotein translocase subunit SecE [Patescibacteria group bacterium]
MAKVSNIIQYIKDSKNELRKVTWPNKREVRQHTVLVIIISLAVALFLGIADYVLSWALEFII